MIDISYFLKVNFGRGWTGLYYKNYGLLFKKGNPKIYEYINVIWNQANLSAVNRRFSRPIPEGDLLKMETQLRVWPSILKEPLAS